MENIVSLPKARTQKKKIRAQMKKYKIKVKDVAAGSTYHLQTVKQALNPDYPYWNFDVVSLAQSMIDSKRNGE